MQNQTGSVRLNQNTTHEQTYEEDSKAENDDVVVVDNADSTQEDELGSTGNNNEANLKFIASLKAELESARTLVDT